MNKEENLRGKVEIESIIYHQELSMKNELATANDEKALLKFIADRLIDITTELRLISHTKL